MACVKKIEHTFICDTGTVAFLIDIPAIEADIHTAAAPAGHKSRRSQDGEIPKAQAIIALLCIVAPKVAASPHAEVPRL